MLPQLAQAVVDAGAIAYLAPLISNVDAKLKRQVCSALGQIAKHTVDLAELVVEGEIFPKSFVLLRDADEYVRKNAATLIREIAKHTPELAQLIVNAGVPPPLPALRASWHRRDPSPRAGLCAGMREPHRRRAG